MNICILFDAIDASTGGGNQFLKALVAELGRAGHQVSPRPTEDTEVVLLNGFQCAPGRRLRVGQLAEIRQVGRVSLLWRILFPSRFETLPRQGPVLVHRVDGVPKLARGRRTVADVVQPAVNRLADHTIFQSEFCRESFVEHGGDPPKRSCVINNGVDGSIFYAPPNVPSIAGGLRFVAASWSPNRRKGFSTLAMLSKVPHVQLVFAGNWCPDVDPASVELVGVLSAGELAQLMRTAHALVHSGWNDSCSNTIVEAMACGLPVMYRDSGGNAELVGDCGVALTDDLEETVALLTEDYGALAERVRSQRSRFLVDRAAREYVATFTDAVGYTPWRS